MTSPWVALIGLVLGIIGLLATVWSVKATRRTASPRYNVLARSTVLASSETEAVPKLKCAYDGKPVAQLSTAAVAFWNAGNAVLNGSDIAKRSPIELCLDPGAEVVDAVVWFASDKANEIAIARLPDGLRVGVSFDFLDARDGCVIHLAHTGRKDHGIRFKGKLKGAQIEDDAAVRGRFTQWSSRLAPPLEKVNDLAYPLRVLIGVPLWLILLPLGMVFMLTVLVPLALLEAALNAAELQPKRFRP